MGELSTDWVRWLVYLLAAMSFGGAIVNMRPPKPLAEDYVKWGYPSWWHYVTAAVSLVSGAMLLYPPTCGAGALLLAGLAVAAIATLVRHGQITKALPAFFLLVAAILVLQKNYVG